MSKRTINVANILKIRSQILASPQAFSMSDFIDDSEVVEAAEDAELELTGHDVVEMLIKEPDCGTTACIAGWAITLAHHGDPEAYPVFRGMQASSYVRAGMDYMKLDPWTALELFYAAKRNEDGETVTKWNLDSITAEEAAEALRHLADTGEVDWSHLSNEPHSHTQEVVRTFGISLMIHLGLIPDPQAKT